MYIILNVKKFVPAEEGTVPMMQAALPRCIATLRRCIRKCNERDSTVATAMR